MKRAEHIPRHWRTPPLTDCCSAMGFAHPDHLPTSLVSSIETKTFGAPIWRLSDCRRASLRTLPTGATSMTFGIVRNRNLLLALEFICNLPITIQPLLHSAAEVLA